jgi:hypothetical protein
MTVNPKKDLDQAKRLSYNIHPRRSEGRAWQRLPMLMGLMAINISTSLSCLTQHLRVRVRVRPFSYLIRGIIKSIEQGVDRGIYLYLILIRGLTDPLPAPARLRSPKPFARPINCLAYPLTVPYYLEPVWSFETAAV